MSILSLAMVQPRSDIDNDDGRKTYQKDLLRMRDAQGVDDCARIAPEPFGELASTMKADTLVEVNAAEPMSITVRVQGY